MTTKVAVTGRPDVGKSTILKIIECEYPKNVVAGSDALDAINTSVFPEIKSDFARRGFQKALYSLQVQLESVLCHENPKKLLLFDHGSLDLIALWPDTIESFFHELGTTLEQELARYEYVIQINGFDKNYVIPGFSPKYKPYDLWKQHPHFLEIPAQRGFSYSYMETNKIIKALLGGQTFAEIENSITQSDQKSSKSGFLNF